MMNIGKALYSFTSIFLKLDRVIIILLIALPVSISFTSPEFDVVNKTMRAFSHFCFLCWIHAIGYRANESNEANNISLKTFNYIFPALCIMVTSYLLTFFYATKVISHYKAARVTYYEPIWIPVLFGVSYLLTLLLVAKEVVSAEKNRNAGFQDYFTTFLLLLIPFIGVWFIDPRVEKLES